MKKSRIPLYILAFCVFAVSSSSLVSCKTKEGCGLEEKYAVPTDKNGNLSKKRGKSNLFSKKQRKKMKKRQ